MRKQFFLNCLKPKQMEKNIPQKSTFYTHITMTYALVSDLLSYWFYYIDKMPAIQLRIERLNLKEVYVNKDIIV